MCAVIGHSCVYLCHSQGSFELIARHQQPNFKFHCLIQYIGKQNENRLQSRSLCLRSAITQVNASSLRRIIDTESRVLAIKAPKSEKGTKEPKSV
jgi:hypothetical protein